MSRTGVTDFSTYRDGKPPLLRRPGFWVSALLELMDVCAYVAIWLSGEVRPWPFVVAGVLVAFRLLTRIRVRAIWSIAAYVFLIFAGIQLSLRAQLHPLVSTAHLAPIAIAWLGLAKGTENLWGWRMGLGFIGLILASSLTPDFSVTLMIIAFIVSGSIAVACRFFADQFGDRGVAATLPPGFIWTSFKQSGILFLSALVIFPLIPRLQGQAGGGPSEPSKAGYVEEVSLADWNRVSSRGSSAPALRIYGPDGQDPMQFIPDGLLRSRVLSVLHDKRWEPTPPKAVDLGNLQNERLTSLQIVREMTGPASLPVPYGTYDATVDIDGESWRAQRTVAGEWRETRTRNRRFTYTARVAGADAMRLKDRPSAIDVNVPQDMATPRLKELADRLFKGLENDAQKVQAVQGFFLREGFRAAYAEDDGANTDVGADLPPLERFLFSEKSGHCELFASSMAILLRLGGVPARLVAGFRATGNAFGDVLTIRQSDAHAWVEVYLPERGGSRWVPMDPTPRLYRISRFTDWMRDGYDWASAKWAQYITNYGEGDTSVVAQFRAFKTIAKQVASGKNPLKTANSDLNLYLFLVFFVVGAGILSLAALSGFRAFMRRARIPRKNRWILALMRERARFEKATRRSLRQAPEPAPRAEARVRWIARYEAARFGQIDESEQGPILDLLREERRRIERSFRAG